MTNSICKTNLSPVEVGDELLSLATYFVYYIQLAFSVGFEFQVSNLWLIGSVVMLHLWIRWFISCVPQLAVRSEESIFIFIFIKFSLNFFINYTIFFYYFFFSRFRRKVLCFAKGVFWLWTIKCVQRDIDVKWSFEGKTGSLLKGMLFLWSY